jgi:hypothetical protein
LQYAFPIPSSATNVFCTPIFIVSWKSLRAIEKRSSCLLPRFHQLREERERKMTRTFSRAISSFSTGLSSVTGGARGGAGGRSSSIGDACLANPTRPCDGVPSLPIPLECSGGRPPSPSSSINIRIDPVDAGLDSDLGGTRLVRREEEGSGGGGMRPACCWRRSKGAWSQTEEESSREKSEVG